MAVTAIEDLLTTMARLRGPGGCPWDHEQTHHSLAETLIEECAELLDTIDREDRDHMREELGDVLLQVVFHAQIASEDGGFTFDDVAREINDKLVRRHPHVFGDSDAQDSEAVLEQWEAIKAAEKKNGPPPSGIFKALPPKLPALLFARDVFKQIRKKDLPTGEAIDRDAIDVMAAGLDETTAGETLFVLAAACREAGIDPESALRRHTNTVMEAVEDAFKRSATD